MSAFSRLRRGIRIGLIFMAAAVLILLTAGGVIDRGALIDGIRWVRDEASSATFIVLFVVLPVVGFPVSAFLLLLGAKFAPATALLIMFAAMAVHQGVTYPAGNIFLRPLIERLLARRSIPLPQFPQRGYIWPSILFMAVPGLSYTMKNYILALSGIPFRDFFLISWLVQAAMGIPLVLVGEAAGRRHAMLLVVVLAILAAFYGFRFWILRLRRRKHM